jgi:hypothetical protein
LVEDDEIDVNRFLIDTLYIINSVTNDESAESNLWVAKVIEIDTENKILKITYFDKHNGKNSYQVIDETKIHEVSMITVLIASFQLTKKNTKILYLQFDNCCKDNKN